MIELVVHIDEKKKPLIKKLVKQLGGSIEETKMQFSTELKQAVKELNDIKKGRKKARNADEFLNEIHR